MCTLVVDARLKCREFRLMIMIVIMIMIIQTLYQKFTDVVIPPFIVDSTWCHLEWKIKSSFCVFVHWYIDRFSKDNSSALMMANWALGDTSDLFAHFQKFTISFDVALPLLRASPMKLKTTWWTWFNTQAQGRLTRFPKKAHWCINWIVLAISLKRKIYWLETCLNKIYMYSD